jgi:hypothetical protein
LRAESSRTHPLNRHKTAIDTPWQVKPHRTFVAILVSMMKYMQLRAGAS